MPEDQNEPSEITLFKRTEKKLVQDATPEGEPRTVSPFMRIDRGEDTIDPETDAVIFADFSPTILPADVAEEIPVVAPKDASAPGLAPSSESTQTQEQRTLETPVLTPAETGDGIPKTNESLKPPSSTDPKSGPSEQPV